MLAEKSLGWQQRKVARTKVWWAARRNANARWLNWSALGAHSPRGCQSCVCAHKKMESDSSCEFLKSSAPRSPSLEIERAHAEIANSNNSPRAARRFLSLTLLHAGEKGCTASDMAMGTIKCAALSQALILRIVNETDLVGDHNKHFLSNPRVCF